MDVLRAFGVKVKEFEAWRDRGQGDFFTIWGVITHHTGSNNASAASIAYGHEGLKGLLSQIHLDRNSVATITGAGIAWHAGVGSWPGIQTNNANAVTIGVEANSDGVSPWPPEMLDAYHRICAAICWFLGHSSLRTIGHKEWAKVQGKWDPGGVDMAQFRAKVQYYIDHPPFMPPPRPVTEAGEDMAFWDDQVKSLVDPNVSYPRHVFLQNIDMHAFFANMQSKKTLEELKLVRDDNQRILSEMQLMRDDISELATAVLSGVKKDG
ncbi:endolysin [Rhodococcus phage ReqiPoco6]|uniref:N-acetylmuramoyl-L-alanine amidase n=1 Tax=Rhodococcus phage ReqiPoco6 TaxID=691964 RepID=D4P7N0_9CAUD|nr:endolysin [Rhodococcus phage ReqiPoco6]ADD81010.1 LysA [Rhodococcus phage ReqiPoco6]